MIEAVTLAKWRKQAAVPVGDVSHAPAVLSVEGRTHDVKVCFPRADQGAAGWFQCSVSENFARLSTCFAWQEHVKGCVQTVSLCLARACQRLHADRLTYSPPVSSWNARTGLFRIVM